MREAVRNGIKMGWGHLFDPAPSLFDIFIAYSLFGVFFNQKFEREIFFVFYSLFLLCFTFMIKPKREYKSVSIFILAFWSLISVFIHSYAIYPNSFTYFYKNFCLMSEGFIYMLSGILFLVVIIKYSTNLKFVFLLFPIMLIPFIRDGYFEGHIFSRFTLLLSFLVSIALYTALSKKWLFFSLIAVSGIGTFLLNSHRIMINFIARPLVVRDLAHQILNHPFIGSGFEKTLKPDHMIFTKDWGWLYRHNDLLSIGAYLGIIPMICLVKFIWDNFRLIGINYKFVIYLTVLLTSLFQMTFFYTDKAIVFLLIIGICIAESLKNKEELCFKD